MTEPDYMSSSKKYETSIHTTPVSLEKFTILNANLKNDYTGSKFFKKFGGCKAAIGHNYCSAGSFFVHNLNYGY